MSISTVNFEFAFAIVRSLILNFFKCICVCVCVFV